MNCMNCGAFLADKDLDYCPHCGCNVLIQKKVEYLSKLYYNQGLEKASIRDLSGAVNCLKQSLTFNKRNIQARNLLGLVYFETGEVVAALSEWVISRICNLPEILQTNISIVFRRTPTSWTPSTRPFGNTTMPWLFARTDMRTWQPSSCGRSLPRIPS